jgi:hypothetical protein
LDSNGLSISLSSVSCSSSNESSTSGSSSASLPRLPPDNQCLPPNGPAAQERPVQPLWQPPDGPTGGQLQATSSRSRRIAGSNGVWRPNGRQHWVMGQNRRRGTLERAIELMASSVEFDSAAEGRMEAPCQGTSSELGTTSTYGPP